MMMSGRRPLRATAILAALIGLVAFSIPAVAQKKSSLRTDQVRGEYVPPKEEGHERIHDVLRERRVLEQLREALSPLRLPRRLTLKIEGCDGVANAYYEEDTVTICYEYLDYILKNAPKEATAGGLVPADALIGPTVDVFLHEVGHAVFDMLEVPALGREEDAADLFSAYIILHFAPTDAKRLIQGVAFLGAKDAEEAQAKAPELNDFADSHGLPAQRYLLFFAWHTGSTRRSMPMRSRSANCRRIAPKHAPTNTRARARFQQTNPTLRRPDAAAKVLPKVRFKWDAPG